MIINMINYIVYYKFLYMRISLPLWTPMDLRLIPFTVLFIVNNWENGEE